MILFLLCLLQLKTATANEITHGYFKAVRRCSDGSVPRDTLGIQPLLVHFADDGTFETLAIINNRCPQYTKGRYELTAEHLTSQVTASSACPPCPFSTSSDAVTSPSRLEPSMRGFTLHLLTHYQAGGSCQPGQSMRIEFIRQPAPTSMSPICAVARR